MKANGYNLSFEGTGQYGPTQVNVNCWNENISISLSGVRLDLSIQTFERIAIAHLMQQGCFVWTKEAQTAAYAMAHMVGALNDDDSWKGLRGRDE